MTNLGIQKQKKYFEKLADVIDTPIYTAKNFRQGNDFKPSKQYRLGNQFPPLDHRTIGSNEVVIELDAPSYAQNYKYATPIIEYLSGSGIPYYAYWSGNKSIHLHIFLKLDINSDDAKEIVGKAIDSGCNIFQEIRLKFVQEILEQSGLTSDLIGHGKIVDLAKLKWDDISGKTTLIRAEGGDNAKLELPNTIKHAWKTYFETLPSSKPRPLTFDDVTYPENIVPHTLDERWIAVVASNYLASLTPKSKKELETIDFKGDFLNVPCVQKILEGCPVGVRNIGAKILAIAAKMDKLGPEDAKKVLKKYVASCPQVPDPYTMDEAEQWLKWVFSSPKPYWTCAHAISIGMCDPLGCPYYKQRHDKELKVFDHDQPLMLVREALDATIVGESSLKIQLFLLYLTKEFGPEWCIMLDGPAASGKTHTMKRVAELFGDEDDAYFVYSRFTEASLNHMEELAKKWKGKIVIIEELQGAKRVVEQLRVAISEGKLTLIEATEVVQPDGTKGHSTSSKTIDLKDVLFVTCNAEETDEGEQLKSRSWILNTDQSSEQTKEIVRRYLSNFTGSVKEVPHFEEIRAALKYLERPAEVWFPFSQELEPFIPTKTVRGRRDIKKLISLVKASAYFHQKRRKWLNLANNKRVLIADWRDVLCVFSFAGDSLNASTQGVGSKDLEYYEIIVRSMTHVPEFGVEDVSLWCKISVPGARKVMSNLAAGGFFENLSKPGVKAKYVRTAISPDYMGDIVQFCVDRIKTQDEQIEQFVLKMGENK